MKRFQINLLLAFLYTIGLISACTGGRGNTLGSLPVPKEVPYNLREYIKNPLIEVAYKNVFPINGMEVYYRGNPGLPRLITRTQALKDLEMLEYLIQTAYSGKDHWEMSGLDFDGVFRRLRKLVHDHHRDVPRIVYERWLSKEFEQIIDGHFSIFGGERHSYFRHQSAFLSDILIQYDEVTGEYRVIDSLCENVPVGSVFTQQDKRPYLFKTLSPRNKTHFLIGILSYEKTSCVDLSFNNKTTKIPLHPCRMGSARSEDQSAFSIQKVDDIPIVKVKSFSTRFHDSLVEFEAAGVSIRSENVFVFDLRNNPGGNSTYVEQFFFNLNGAISLNYLVAVLWSPATVQFWLNQDSPKEPSQASISLVKMRESALQELKREPRKLWSIYSGACENQHNAYRGNAIILVNRNSLSTSEIAISIAKCLENSVLIGENTAGMLTFGEILSYRLPYSRLIVILPSKIFLIKGLKEGRGFIPDFWLDTHAPVKEITRWIKDRDNYRYTLGG